MLMTDNYPNSTMTSNVSTANSTLCENESDGFSERLRLKIQPHPPKFPFRDHPFEITVYLVDPSDHLKSGVTVPLSVELYSSDKMIPVEKPIMKIDPSTKPVMNGDGICKLRIRILECSMALGNRKFVLHIAASKQAPPELMIVPAVTSEMTVIQHRLVIQEKLPELWYKDEGGRDKCMTLPIYLVNEKNERVGNRPVPLRVTLLYESEHPVLKQDILKMSPDCQRVIDSTGKALLKLRIEDVSKNHQGQAFRLKVEADTAQSPMNFDVAFDLSSTISVRSKRNKRRPQKNAPVTHHIITGVSNPASATSSPSSTAEHDTNSTLGSGFGSFSNDDRRKKIRTTPKPSPSVESPSSNSAGLTGAMESVLSWTGAVVHGLHQLEWQTVGYESKSDGTPDPERPIYRCPACWRYKDVMTYDTAQHDTKCLIANLLLTYATDTMMHLDQVLKSIEQFPTLLASDKNRNSMPTLLGSSGMVNGATDLPASSPLMASNIMMNTSMVNPLSSTNPIMSSAAPTLTRGIPEMMNVAMEGPPGLFRGNSGGLSEFMRSLDDQDGQDGTAAALYQSSQTSEQVASAIEMQVFYVLARMITLDSSNVVIGFPAFDSAMNLLGFYQEARESSTTEVVFVPLSDVSINQMEIARAHRLLRNELKDNSTAVHTLARCSNDLVKLKEDVILFHWNAKDARQPAW